MIIKSVLLILAAFMILGNLLIQCLAFAVMVSILIIAEEFRSGSTYIGTGAEKGGMILWATGEASFHKSLFPA